MIKLDNFKDFFENSSLVKVEEVFIYSTYNVFFLYIGKKYPYSNLVPEVCKIFTTTPFGSFANNYNV